MFRTLPSIALLATVAVSTSALATDGYFSHGYGTASKGMAGAGTAFSTEALSVATNPANVQLAESDRLDIGMAYFSPDRGFKVSGNPSGQDGTFPFEPGNWNSDSEQFFIPHLAFVGSIDASSSFGLALYGNGGMNTDYANHDNPVRNQGGTCPGGTFCAGKTGVDLSQLFLVPSYALRVHPTMTLGVAPIIAYQRFKAVGLGAFGQQGFSADPTALTNNDYDDSFGYGVRVGANLRINEGMALGASYQSRIMMSEFDKYKGLFAEQGGFDIPSTMNIGAAFSIARGTTLLVDVFHTRYSEVNSIANPLIPNLQTAQLGNDKGAGFGWDDITVIKLGISHALTPTVTLRGGYSHGDSPINNRDVVLNTLAPGVVTDHYTLGTSLRLNAHQTINVSAMYATSDTIRGSNDLDPAQEIELYMDQYDFELSFSQTF